MAEPTITEMEARLNHLERDNRWLKWTAALMAVAWVLVLVILGRITRVGSQPVMKQIIETGRLIIKDAAGKTRAVVGQAENTSNAEPEYGIFIYSKDGESESWLTPWNFHIHHDKGSANFSPISVEMSQHRVKVSSLFREVSRLSDKATKQNLTKQEQVDLDRLSKDLEPVAKFYINMAGPYLELTKQRDGQDYSGAGEVQVGVVPYPSVALRSLEDNTSFSLSALKDSAGITIRDGHGSKRASLDVDSSDGAAMNLYDKDGKTARATFGSVTLQTIRTGGIQQRPASLVLFDKDGKVYWSTP